MKNVLTLLVFSSLLFVSACADEKVEPQKSPCVGNEGSPCGPKRAVNGKPRETVENLTALYNFQG